MSVARSARLQAAARIALWREQQQRRQWQRSEELCRQQRESLSRLEQYHEEYLVSAPHRARVGVSSLSNFSRFMQDLSQAIQLQRRQLADSSQRAAHSRTQWRQLYDRCDAIRSLQSEMLAIEQREAERRREHTEPPWKYSSF